jgi:hypothetical protein
VRREGIAQAGQYVQRALPDTNVPAQSVSLQQAGRRRDLMWSKQHSVVQCLLQPASNANSAGTLCDWCCLSHNLAAGILGITSSRGLRPGSRVLSGDASGIEPGLDNLTGGILRDKVGSFIVSLSAGQRRQRFSYRIRVHVKTTCMEVSFITIRMLLYPILVVLSLCRLTPEGAIPSS